MTLGEADQISDSALSFMSEGRIGDALQMLLEIEERFPDVDRFLFRTGLALERLNRFDEAIGRYKRAIELHPEFGIFHHAFIRLISKSGDAEIAIGHYSSLGGVDVLPADLQRFLFLTLLTNGASPLTLQRNFAECWGSSCAFVSLCGTEQTLPYGTIRLTKKAKQWSALVSQDTLKTAMFVDRLFTLIPAFEFLASSDADDGAALLSLDDLPPDTEEPILCFSGFADNHYLIPDTAFLESKAYAKARATISEVTNPWAERKPMAYWRGALTGEAQSLEAATQLPRANLARLSLENRSLDAKLTSLNQFESVWPEIRDILAKEDLIGAHEEQSTNSSFQVAIDIDGNSNAWSGFFVKMFCGSPIIKIQSKFKQWYYQRLVPGEHYFGIQSLEGELTPAIETLLNNAELSISMASRAAEIALSMTVESELHVFVSAFGQACTTDPIQGWANAEPILSGQALLNRAIANLGEVRSPTLVFLDPNSSVKQLNTLLEQGHREDTVLWISEFWKSEKSWVLETIAAHSLLVPISDRVVGLMIVGEDLVLTSINLHRDLLRVLVAVCVDKNVSHSFSSFFGSVCLKWVS